ncbi:curlin [Shewanella sp. AS16]|uniref:curlin n=1 Tax=Shewanella sp. AS16 TaxID=2907625 RepID=UPI001F35C3A9|nr:curlin [Shewanella sp. AS16]MCE9685730.1 curlin [Shewanella sp. AS16]
MLLGAAKAPAADIEDDRSTQELPVTLQTLLESSGRDNLIDLVQLGSFNHATLMQSGNDNSTSVLQTGSNNQADVAQYGGNNRVALHQAGIRNQAAITQIGNDNLVQLNQLGSASFSIEQIADGAEITITQY